MKLLIFVSVLLAAEAAKLQQYTLPTPQGTSDTRNTGNDVSSSFGHSPSDQQHSSAGVSLPISGQNEHHSQSLSGSFSQSLAPSNGQSFASQVTKEFSAGPTQSAFNGQSFAGQVTDGSSAGPTQSAFNGLSFAGQVTDGSSTGPTQSAFNGQSFAGQVTDGSSTGPTQSAFSGQSFAGQVTGGSFASAGQSTFSSQFSENAIQSNTSPEQFQSDTQNAFVRDSSLGFSGTASNDDCQEGQVKHFDGRCVTPEVTRNVFVYAAPQRPRQLDVTPVDIPLPKIEHNIVFIRTEELERANDPIIVPPPQRKNIIYVLNKESEFGGQRVIEITTPEPKQPEVYFVNYADGQTPTLPDGTDFETALRSAIQSEGQVISGAGGFDSRDEQGTGFVGNVETPAVFSTEGAHTDFDVPSESGASSTNIDLNNGVFATDFEDTNQATASLNNFNSASNAAVSSVNNFVDPSSNQNSFSGNVGISVIRDEGASSDAGAVSHDDANSISSNIINVDLRGNSASTSGSSGIAFAANTLQATQPAAGTVTPQALYSAP